MVLLVALVAPSLLVGVAYTGMLAERRRELGTMLAIGVPRRDIVATVAVEAALAAVTGASAGVVLAAASIAAFLRTTGFDLEQQAIPLEFPPLGDVARYAAISGMLVAAAAIAAAMIAAWLAARREPWSLLRSESA